MARLDKKLNIRDIAKGTVTIPAGSTSALITHNLGSVPVVTLTPKSAIAVPYWPSDESATEATANIYISLDDPISFGYEAII